MKHKKNISDSVMEKITEHKIIPKARWEFLLKNYFVWGVGVLAALVGGVATSGIIFVFQNSDWFMYRRLSGSFFSHAGAFLPLLWIMLLVGFACLAVYQMKHTKRGYTYPVVALIGANILISTVLGVVLYRIGYAHILDVRTGMVLPMYESVEQKRETLWVQPENGLLAGLVVSATEDGVFLLQDYKGDMWEVSDGLLDEVDSLVLLSVDEIGIVGTQTGDFLFEACAVRPWNIAGQHQGMREEMKLRMVRAGRYGNTFMLEEVPPAQIITLPNNKPQGKGVGRMNSTGQANLDRVRLQDLRDIVCELATTTQK
jgi:hypothetical protein